MEKISYDTILDIQRKVNIVDIISEYLPLQQKGKNYFAICPFHDDHNPSLSISPEKQIYTCFVCGESGNVYNFVMNYEKISFTEAVSKVAKKAGVNLNINFEKKKTVDNKKTKYYKLYDIVSKYYQNNIRSSYGKKAIDYLKQRNINDQIIKEFEIGLSLNDNNVTKLLESKGYSNDELVDIGICGESNNNYIYDIFRNRIMFPLYDTDGNTVGFSGRIYNGEDDSKYVNSKESVIFKKGSLLYNYHRAMKYAKEKHEIIIVEGFMDVIRLYTIGIKNVVATMGTAITKEHADLIRRLSKNVILCFDGDKAGEKATISAVDALEKIDINPKIIRLEDNLDPDDYIVKKGKEAFLNHLNNLMSSLSFKLDTTKSKTNFNDYNEVSNYLKDVVKELEKIDDKIVYELTVKKLSKETGVDIDTINSMVLKLPKSKKVIVDKRKQVYKDKYKKAEEYLIYYMLKDKKAIDIYKNKVSYLRDKKLSRIAMEILEFYEKNGYINVTDFTIFLKDKSELINEVLRIDEFNIPNNIDIDVINDYVKTIDDGILKNEIEKVKEEIKTESNVAKKVVLLQKLSELKKKECK